MRHCIRSTQENDVHGVAGYTSFDDYAAQPWERFEVPAMHCLRRGARIVKATGAWYKKHGQLPDPLRVVADNCERDQETGKKFLEGFGVDIDNKSFVVNSRPFYANWSETICPSPSPNKIIEATMEHWRAFATPPSHTNKMATLYARLGVGNAGNWTNTPCEMNMARAIIEGNCAVASDITERLLMDLGGGMKLAWGRIEAHAVPDFLTLHSWYRTVAYAVPAISANESASIVKALVDILGENAQGTTVFAGHDSELNGLSAALGLSWDAAPFPVNGTMPGSALRFDREGDKVQVSYVYVSDFSEETGTMTSVPVSTAGSQGEVSHKELSDLAQQGSNAACAHKFEFVDYLDEPEHDPRLPFASTVIEI